MFSETCSNIGSVTTQAKHLATLLSKMLSKILPMWGLLSAIMPGNRDFLLGQEFAYRTGSTILKDATVQPFFGRQVLLLHGDSLCTDDEAHQSFRFIVDQPEWRLAFLDKPISERDDIGRAIRFRSNIEKRYKTSQIMDVNQNAVEAALKPTEARLLIHGHTHRPGIHQWTLNGANLLEGGIGRLVGRAELD